MKAQQSWLIRASYQYSCYSPCFFTHLKEPQCHKQVLNEILLFLEHPFLLPGRHSWETRHGPPNQSGTGLEGYLLGYFWSKPSTKSCWNSSWCLISVCAWTAWTTTAQYVRENSWDYATLFWKSSRCNMREQYKMENLLHCHFWLHLQKLQKDSSVKERLVELTFSLWGCLFSHSISRWIS